MRRSTLFLGLAGLLLGGLFLSVGPSATSGDPGVALAQDGEGADGEARPRILINYCAP